MSGAKQKLNNYTRLSYHFFNRHLFNSMFMMEIFGVKLFCCLVKPSLMGLDVFCSSGNIADDLKPKLYCYYSYFVVK